jgi:hypothetical protein
MGLEGGTSRYEDIERDRIEEPLLDKSEFVGRGYQIQPDSVLSVPSSQDGSTVFGYNVGVRPFQDLIFTIIFLLLVLVSAAFGIYGVIHSNPDYQLQYAAQYDPSQGCTIPENVQVEPISATGVRWEIMQIFMAQILRSVMLKNRAPSASPVWITGTLGITLALSGPLALAVLFLLRSYTKELVYATLPFIVLLPVALNLTWFIFCQLHIECRTEFDSSIQYAIFGTILFMCGLMAYVIYSNWDRIEITIRVIKTSSEALYQNLALLFVLPSLSLGLVAFCIPFVTFMNYAYANGKLVPNPESVDHPTRSTDAPCVWEPAAWVPCYIYLSGFTILWSSMIMAQIQVLTISGTISQWYFAQAGSSTLNATKRALRYVKQFSFPFMVHSDVGISEV